MKKLYPFFILAIFALGACETVEIEKLVFDTVYVDRPIRSLVQTVHVDTVYKELLRVDTVEVTVVVHDTIIQNVVVYDTVFQVKTDSVFIETIVEKIVNHYDTIVQTVYDTIINNVTKTVYVDKIVEVHDTIYITEYEQRVVYQSVEFVFPGRDVFFIPDELKPYYDSFIADAASRGVPLPGGSIIFQWVPIEEIPGTDWSSVSFKMNGSSQWVVNIYEGLLIEESKASIYREMGRMQLGKKYVADESKLMCPWHDNQKEVTVQEINELFL